MYVRRVRVPGGSKIHLELGTIVLGDLDQGPRDWINNDVGPMRGYSEVAVGLMCEPLSMTS